MVKRRTTPRNVSKSNQDVGDLEQNISYSNDQLNNATIPARRVRSLHRKRTNNFDTNEIFELRPRLGSTDGQPKDIEKHLNDHANKIIAKMEEDPDLMENNIISQKLRQQALRNMPQSLTVKRLIKTKLNKTLRKESKGRSLSFYKSTKYKISMKLKKFNVFLRNVLYSWEMWYSAIRRIEGSYSSGIGSYFRYLRWLLVFNLTFAFFVILFIVAPQVAFSNTKDTYNSSSKFNPLDVFSGEGFLTDSILYYGFYLNNSIGFFNLQYHMPYAYFYTMFMVYLISLLVLGASVAVSYRKSFIETEGGLKNVYAYKIFCGWDFSIATKEAAKLKSSAIYHELKELLSDNEYKNAQYSSILKAWNFVVHFMAHAIIFSLLMLTGYLIWFLLEKHRLELINPILVPIIITLINNVLPIFFSVVIRFEDYKNPRLKLNISLLRRTLLSFTIVGVLGAYWLINSFKQECWETYLGQEIYRLIIFDTLFCTLTAFLKVLWFFANRYFERFQGTMEFNIASCTLELIYGQLLLGLGLFFAPLLAVIIVIKLFFTWYIKEYLVLKFSKPSLKSWRSAQTQTWFLAFTFLGQLFSAGLLLFILVRIPPSSCGPFRDYNYFYEILFMGDEDHKNLFFRLLSYLTKPGVAAIIILSLSIRVYYLRAKAIAHRDMVRLLRNMLSWESKDKEFLLQYISSATKGEFHYTHWNERGQDPYLAVLKYDSKEINENDDDKYDTVNSQDVLLQDNLHEIP